MKFFSVKIVKIAVKQKNGIEFCQQHNSDNSTSESTSNIRVSHRDSARGWCGDIMGGMKLSCEGIVSSRGAWHTTLPVQPPKFSVFISFFENT